MLSQICSVRHRLYLFNKLIFTSQYLKKQRSYPGCGRSSWELRVIFAVKRCLKVVFKPKSLTSMWANVHCMIFVKRKVISIIVKLYFVSFFLSGTISILEICAYSKLKCLVSLREDNNKEQGTVAMASERTTLGMTNSSPPLSLMVQVPYATSW